MMPAGMLGAGWLPERVGMIGGAAAWLLLGAVVVLVLASIAVLAISARLPASKEGFSTELRQRTWAWWYMIGVLGAALLLGETVTLLLFAVLSLSLIHI